MSVISFQKWHGCQNDFIVILTEQIDHTLNAKEICHRHRGVGADGILWLKKTSDPRCFSLTIINSDGSEAKNCGNGLRCAAAYLFDNNLCKDPNIQLSVQSSNFEVKKTQKFYPKTSLEFCVKMPAFSKITNEHQLYVQKIFDEKLGLKLADNCFISLENPHLVIDQSYTVDREQIYKVGEILNQGKFGINIHLIESKNKDSCGVYVFERGVGPTLACGSGACAVAYYLEQAKETPTNSYQIHMPGGLLGVVIEENTPTLYGPAKKTFEGTITL